MNTHDIELPLLPPHPPVAHVGGRHLHADCQFPALYTWARNYALAAIEADRKRRGGPVAIETLQLLKDARHRIANLSRAEVPFRDPLDGPVLRRLDAAIAKHQQQAGEPIGEVLAFPMGGKPQTHSTLAGLENPQPVGMLVYAAPQPAEPIVSDVEAIVRLLESREWAEHVATTPLGQRLETAVTVLVGADPQPSEPDKQHPDDVAVDAFAAAMKAKLKRAREEKGRGGWRMCGAGHLSRLLREHVEKGDPVDVANLAMMLHQNGQRIEPADKVLERRQTLKHQGYQPIQSGPLLPPPPAPHPAPQPAEPVKVPPGYVLIAEDYLEAMIGPERMDHLRRSCRFPAL